MPITTMIQEAMHKDQRQYEIQLNGSTHGNVKDLFGHTDHNNGNKQTGSNLGNQKQESPISIMK